MTSLDDIKARVCAVIDAQADRIVTLSDDIMRHPETGFREQATARRVVDQLRAMGVDFRDGLAKTGVRGCPGSRGT
ncbi:hypothetical protein SAMN05661080_05110 [Modestobacter sp. DSM 44400]|uniref:hypothetical protein n=1 Tax=Modestobacter sp. DSM 44400 TaxID=1550230 RepID=UPI000898EB65|nr:hypothetical protein [Modestobacter sp. DSM 44400]SDY94734.1 hypothetical protein SAMN05661080_05110 [Modestobacter sp. DSM 44400]